MTERIVFSGIQPTGNLHIGNYLGAIRQWVKNQNNGLNIFCVVDMHAITIEQKPEVLRENTLKTAALLLAAGIDPEKSILFVQSQNKDHANLAWIMNCNLSMGQLNRMTQYKEKSDRREFVSVGLFDYPSLMAADILLYNTTEVPVGDDQKQHVELARDVAERFNSRLGETFVLPKPVIPESGARIMSLTNPTNKMSKSDENAKSRIDILESADEIRSKISSSVTDSDNNVHHDRANKPGVSNLMEIYAEFKNINLEEVEKEFSGKSYKDFKEAVAEAIVEGLSPIQAKYQELMTNGKVHEVLAEGAQKANEISNKKLLEVYDKVGFVSL